MDPCSGHVATIHSWILLGAKAEVKVEPRPDVEVILHPPASRGRESAQQFLHVCGPENHAHVS